MDQNIINITNFLKADKGIKEQLESNLGNYGNEMVEEMSHEVIKFLRIRVGLEGNLSPRQIQDVIFKTYGFGVERFMAEYDRGTLTDRDLTNENFEIEEQHWDRAMHRRRQIHVTIEQLESRHGHKCDYWGDFSNRTYDALRDKVLDAYGPEAAKKFDYYGYYDVREELQQGLNSALNKTHDRTMGAEEMYYLDNGVKGLEEAANSTRVAYRESLAAQFK